MIPDLPILKSCFKSLLVLPVILAVLVAGLGGCKKKETVVALPVEEIPTAIQESFITNSEPEVVKQVQSVVVAVEKNDPDAIFELERLAARPGLTEEQQKQAGRAMATMMQRLSAKAAEGDKKSEEALRKYQLSK